MGQNNAFKAATRLVDGIIPPTLLSGDPEELRRARAIVGIILALLPWMLYFGVVYAIRGTWWIVVGTLLGAVAYACVLLVRAGRLKP